MCLIWGPHHFLHSSLASPITLPPLSSSIVDTIMGHNFRHPPYSTHALVSTCLIVPALPIICLPSFSSTCVNALCHCCQLCSLCRFRHSIRFLHSQGSVYLALRVALCIVSAMSLELCSGSYIPAIPESLAHAFHQTTSLTHAASTLQSACVMTPT